MVVKGLCVSCQDDGTQNLIVQTLLCGFRCTHLPSGDGGEREKVSGGEQRCQARRLHQVPGACGAMPVGSLHAE